MKEYKILQLNVWTGRIKGRLLEFIKENDFDLICIQEAVWSENEEVLKIFSATVNQIKECSNLQYESRAANWYTEAFHSIIYQGNVILSREEIIDENVELVYGEEKLAENAKDLLDHCYKAQLIKLKNGLNVVNYHGYWLPNPIGDETTIKVMQNVTKMIKKATGPLVMCGDLNIIHESPAMRELDFLKDLTHEYHIDNTLNGLKFNGKVACDHILTSNDIETIKFNVIDDPVSDHKALIATIRIP